MDRRRFLRYLAIVPALPLMGCRRRPAASGQTVLRAVSRPTACAVAERTQGPGRILSRSEWETIEAACERLFPADDGPGARSLGVINYIDAQVQAPPVRAFLPLFRATARELNAQALATWRRRFALLDAAEQDALLRRLEQGTIGRYRGARALGVLLSLTLEGAFGDPVYGGNRGGAGWQMIGFTPRTPRAACPYWSSAAENRVATRPASQGAATATPPVVR